MNAKLVWQIAFRYLRGKRSLNAVPILSRISMTAIAVGSAAMIILFSVFNGFEGLVQDLYKAFYPDIKITPAKGKFFHLTGAQLQSIAQLKNIAVLTRVAEDNVLVNSNDEQIVVTLKGIDRNFLAVNDIRSYIIQGNDTVSYSEELPTVIAGAHIASQLGLDVNNVTSRLYVYYPDARQAQTSGDLQSGFTSLQMRPDGVFRIQDEFDAKYILAPLQNAQQLFNLKDQYSSIELKLQPGADADKIKQSLQDLLGKGFRVDTRYEQNRTLYMVMRTEKWAVFAILFLVLLIASFNMIGALSLLVLEKQKDMSILRAMGAAPPTIRAIFVTEGVLWALTGGLSGILLGTVVCLIQQYFQPIKLQGSFIIDAYPVVMKPLDFTVVTCSVIVVGVLAAWFPAWRAARADVPGLKS